MDKSLLLQNDSVVQLNRTSDSGSEGHGFESRRSLTNVELLKLNEKRMKRMIFFVLAIIGTVGMVVAQEQTKKVEEKPKPAVSALEWVSTDINLGEVAHRVPATATYEFVNKGDKPVLITRVGASCGCTSRDYPTKPIMPGEKGSVKLVYNAATLGNFNKSGTVITNEGVAPKALRIRGVVVAKEAEKK